MRPMVCQIFSRKQVVGIPVGIFRCHFWALAVSGARMRGHRNIIRRASGGLKQNNENVRTIDGSSILQIFWTPTFCKLLVVILVVICKVCFTTVYWGFLVISPKIPGGLVPRFQGDVFSVGWSTINWIHPGSRVQKKELYCNQMSNISCNSMENSFMIHACWWSILPTFVQTMIWVFYKDWVGVSDPHKNGFVKWSSLQFFCV